MFEIATDVAIMRDGKIPVRGKVEEFTREMLVKGLLPPDAQEKEDSLKQQIKPVTTRTPSRCLNFSITADTGLQTFP